MNVEKDEFYLERINMVRNQLVPSQINDARIITAMEAIPRHIFVKKKWRPIAYIDDGVEACPGRRLLPPLLLAKMLSYCNLRDSAAVLDIGFGSGYSTAVLAKIVKSVTAVESQEQMLKLAADNMHSLGISNYKCMQAELLEGPMDGSVFDAIIINGAIKVQPGSKPDKLLSQLKRNGILTVIERIDNMNILVKYSYLQGSTIREELEVVEALSLSVPSKIQALQ